MLKDKGDGLAGVYCPCPCPVADPRDLLNIAEAPPTGLMGWMGMGVDTGDEEGNLADINSISIGESVESISKSNNIS
jgi:hypothetical protein